MLLTTAGYLFLTSWARISAAFETSQTTSLPQNSSHQSVLARLYHVPWSAVIGWHGLEQFYFYATGHQPTFPTIPWNAAFVGGFNSAEYGASTSESVVTSYIVPAVLVGWNTFVSRAWFGFLLPLLLLGPFAVWLAFPLTRPIPPKTNQTDLEDPQMTSPEDELAKG